MEGGVLRNISSAERACKIERNGSKCFEVGTLFLQRGLESRALPYLRRGCMLRNARSCILYAKLTSNSYERELALQKAKVYLKKACLRGDSGSCGDLKQLDPNTFSRYTPDISKTNPFYMPKGYRMEGEQYDNKRFIYIKGKGSVIIFNSNETDGE